MKTLDEVIELSENILTFANLPKDDTTSTVGIALFYLREYREIKNHLACMNNAEIRGDGTQIINNPPLTWDELQMMEGEPVWIEHLCGVLRWGIIDDLFYDRKEEKTKIRFGTRHGFLEWNKDDIGNDWRAYRKEKRERFN